MRALGALNWWYQTAPEDWQDLDLVAPPVLYRDSKIRDIVAFGGKDGYVTASIATRTRCSGARPRRRSRTCPKDPPKKGMKTCPGYAGGVEWNGPALDRLNNTLITGAVDACFTVELGSTKYAAGEAVFGGQIEPVGPTTRLDHCGRQRNRRGSLEVPRGEALWWRASRLPRAE